MPDLKQALKDFVATSNSGKYKDEKTLMSKFPELAGYDVQALKDYVATSNSGKYKDEATLNSKFPEFFTQKKNPNQSGVSNLDNGSSDSQGNAKSFPKIDPNGFLPNFEEIKNNAVTPKTKSKQSSMSALDKNSIIESLQKNAAAPKDLDGKKLFESDKTTQEVKKRDLTARVQQEREIIKKSIPEYDPSITENNLQTEKEQTGFLNKTGQFLKDHVNVLAKPFSKINELAGGDKDYFQMEKYKPLQDQQKKYIEKAKKEGLPLTPEAIQKGAEDIFREEDRMQQLHARVDANTPFGFNDEGVFKELNLENIKKNDALKRTINIKTTYESVIDDYNKYAAYIERLPKEQLTQAKVDKYNDLLENAEVSQKGLEHLRSTFPKLLKEVKTSGEILELTKYNYNDLEKHFASLKNVTLGIVAGTAKMGLETAAYIEEKTGIPNPANVVADVLGIKGGINNVLDDAREEQETFYHYKAKNINNLSDAGSYVAQFFSEQAPIYATLIVAPEAGIYLLGAGAAGQKFSDMEYEETLPGGHKTSFDQKFWTSALYGTAEGAFERLGTAGIIKRMQATIAKASTGTRKLFYDGVLKENVKGFKRLGLSTGIETATEEATAITQVGADRYIAGKEISNQEANEIYFESGFGGALGGGVMSTFGGVGGALAQKAHLYSENKDIQDTKKILAQIDIFSQDLKNNPNLTVDDKKIIYKQIEDLTNKSFEIVMKNAEKGKNFSVKENQFLVDINVKQDELKQKFEKLKNSNISKEQKQLLTTELNNEFNQLEKDRNGTLKGEFASIPDNRKTITFEKREEQDNLKDDETPSTDFTTLSTQEQTKLKDQAARELIKEKNPDGKEGNFTVTDEEITQRAIENFNKANEQQTTPTPEVPQQTEAEKVDEASKEVADVEEEIRKLQDIRDNGQPLKPLMFEEDYSQEELDDAEKKHKEDVKKHKEDLDQQISQKQTELEALQQKPSPVEDTATPQEKSDLEFLDEVLPDDTETETTPTQTEIELKNEGKAETPTKENVTERLNINNPFYKKVEDALVKLGLIEKYNPETGTGDVVGGYAQQTSDGGFSVGKMLFNQDGSISYFDGDVKISFDKNGNVISENTKETKQKAVYLEIESKKSSIAMLEKTRDSESFKYKEVTETDPLGRKNKVKRLKTEQELKESIDKINAAIDKAKEELKALEEQSNNSQINNPSNNKGSGQVSASIPNSNQIKNDDAPKEPIGELTNDEFLEAIQNDNVSDERLTDIATKLSNNEKLSNREQKIAEKNKEVVKQKTDATKQVKVANLPELTNDEYLDFIDNDKVSNDRLLNIAYKNENQLPLTKLENDIYNSQKKKVDTLQKNNRSWLKDETLKEDVEAEFDNLLSGDAEQRRKDGKYTKDGANYTRQEEQADTPTGNKGTVKFADNVEQEFEYALQEEETVQPAHINKKRNPLHFVPEMQPKNRKDQSSQVASDKIADNPKLDEAGENSNAYSGAPVVNSRGEVIQGNNRSEGLKKHYQRGGTKYKQQLIDNAAKFGFTPAQVQGMKKPVLVRRLKVDDAKAIELGNYDAKDIETGGSRKIDPVTTSRRIPQQDKSKMTESIFENTDTETTLTEAIKQNFKPFFDKIRKYLNPAQVETILGKTGIPNAEGVQDLVKLVQQFIFDGANTDLAEQFERLSYNAKQGLLKSLPNLLSVSKDKSLLTEVQNAIVAVSDFSTSKIENFTEWTNQTSMFEEQQTPKQKYSELELKIAELLINAKKQSDISNVFKQYTNLVSDPEIDFFNLDGAVKGISKEEAVKQVFKTNNNQDGSKQQEQPTATGKRASSEQDGPNDPKGESEPRPEVELFPKSSPNEQGTGNPDTGSEGVEPIRQLGTGSNVYFESEKYRVNDIDNKESKYVLIINGTGNEFPTNYFYSDNLQDLLFIAKKLTEIRPEGIDNKLTVNLEELIKNLKSDTNPTENKEVAEVKEQAVRRHKGIIYQNPKDGYYYEVTGYNSGYYTLKDLETGKVIKEKKEVFENDFIDVSDEIEKQNKGIQSESSGVQNGTNFDVTQFQDNVFEVTEFGRNDAPTYKVVVGKAFDLDSSTVTKNAKPLAKNEKVPQDVLLAIQSHVDKFNPESKQREIKKFLNEKDEAPKAETPKAEPKQSKRKIRDEKVDAELDDAFKNLRDELGKLMSGVNPELAIKGAKIIAIYTKAGIYKLSDIIEDAYAKFGEISKEMFDAIKQGYASYYATVEDSIADQMDGNVRIFTFESIINKLNKDEQAEQPTEPQQKPITDTKPIELKTKAIESKTDKLANDREAKIPTERKLEIANDLLFDIDNEIENVNDQLRLLGVYEPSATDEMRENPHIYVERELKKDLTNFVKKLNERLKWEFDTDKKGKPIVASANIAPAGGDGSFILWVPNSEYGIYVSLTVEPKEYKDWYEQYELRPTIMWRVTTKKDKYRGLSNQWMNSEDFTIPNLVEKFKQATNFYVKQENGSINKQQPEQPSPIAALQPNSKRPLEAAPQELLPKPSSEQGTGSRSQPKSNPVPRATRNVGQSSNGQGNLFSGNANFLEKKEKLNFDNLEFELNDAKNNEVIFVPTQKLLDRHSKDAPSYDIQKIENQIGGRLKNAVEFISNLLKNKQKPYIPSYVYFENNKIGFQDGRHRVLASKQLGINLIPIEVPKSQSKQILDLFSADQKQEVQIEQINQAEKQEPALVDFSLQDNEQDKFNATKKYTDNINALQTLLTIIKEKRKATPEEKTILAKYVGFGGLKEIAFNPDNNEAWKESTVKYKDQVRKVIELTQELDQALGINNSLAEIRAGILTAHYTPKTIIDTMFNVLGKLGFKNGNILEPSAGIGNFIGYMPSKMRSNSNITAVELDNLTGNILKYLFDDANTQITGIQNALVANNSQDVVISNVPFGNFKIFDKEFKGPREFLTKRIHNYFFAKALDKVREGGIVMFVTSKGVLDSKGNQNVREYLNQNADFLGAVRLPSTVFQNNANTSVVTDVIILRKNTTGEKKNQNFIDVVDLEVTDKNGETKTVTINKFFAENRNVLLGEIVPGGMYSEKDYSLADPDNKMGQIWDRVSEMLDQHKGTFQPTTGLNAINRTETDQDLLNNTKNGNIAISNEGKIVKRVGSEFQEVSMPSYVKGASVKKYIDIRNALFDLILMEYSGESDVLIEKLRQRLNFAYTTKRTISAKEFDRIAMEDGDGFNVLALEDNNGKRADIFTKRTINPLKQTQNTDNIEEAIIISLYENAKIDMDRISELMNKPVSEVMEIAKGKIFESPTGGFFTREEYLSGNVKKKLAETKKAIESGYAEFEFNKTELEAVIPKDIPAVSIEVRLGSRWVPVDIINDFSDHLFKGEDVVINYAKSTDTYNNNGKAHSVNATEKWGTKRKNGADLLVDALHAATPAIYDTTEDGKRILNKEETEKAVQKFEEIRAEFENWVYTNAERRERLGAIYNEKYNTTVRRKYDGSHLNIPGINGVNLYPHQKDAIWMLLQNNGGIIDHIVGAGKTFVMVAGTAEMKRTGVAKKPMILALKSTIPQIVETYKQSYPLAKILAPSEKDFQSKNRQKLFSQIALNDWDVVIMSHENFNAIPHRIENLTKQIDDEIAEIEEERDALFDDKKALSGLEKRLNNLQARLEKLTDIAKDNSVKFQEMGIDHVMVDESQQFKNLAYMTKQRNVAGLSKAEGSRRAFNLLVGMRYLQEVFGADKGTTFLSGTPISNSMVEMYSLLKYMRPNKMKELGFNTFDQWATTFASPTNEIEYTVTGQFKSKTRFREFINVPELSLLYNEIADVRNDYNLTLDKPKMKGGGYTTMFIPMNEEQADYGQRIIQFAKTKDGSVLGLELSENQKTAYMLLATNLSSKMAIDMRLINKDYAYDPNGKVGKMTDEAVKVYNETNEHKGVQLIFSDLGTPKNKNNQSEMLKDYMEDELGVPQHTLVEIFGNFAEEGHRYQPFTSIKQKAIDVLEIEETDFEDYVEQAKQSGETFNLYDEIKKRLIEKGIPENEIVFIHSYNNQKAKEKLFEKVNAGEVRVILGSTQKLGTGVNVQQRLAAIHHLDVPWRPSDMEQRNGRGVRQGNWIAKTHLNNEIAVYAYATERTLDGYKYQLLQTKQRFLDQVKSGNIEDRVIKENSEEGSDAYAIFVSELSGNKDILLKFKLEQEKERLTKQRRNFEGSLYEAQGNVRKLESNIPAIEENASKTKQDIESITNKSEYDVTKDDETGIETKKLKISNINGEVLQPEKDSKEAKENKPVERTEYGKKAIELIAQTVKTIKLDQHTKSFEINGIPILVKVSNKKEVSNGKEYVIQKTELAILSPTGQTYTVNNSAIAGVLLNNIQKAIENIPIALEMQEKLINKNKKDLEGYKELAKNDKFPKEEELTKVTAELKEVDKRIQDFEKDVKDDLEQEDNIVNEPSESYGNNRNLALNKTQDGQEFLSLSEPGTEYSNSSQFNLFEQGDTVSNNDNRRSVRAVWTKYKNIQFKGTTKVKNAEDVAQIMSLLENKSVEHAFAIHIDQDGNSHIQFLSIGGVTGTVVDTNLVAAGVSKFNSKKVYLVHNHPSGNMQPSKGDLKVTEELRNGLNPLGIEVEHVIMDTYLKEYVHIANDNTFTVNKRGENTFTKKLTTVALTEQEVLGKPFGRATDVNKVFSIIQNFRFSAMPKNAMLVLNQRNEVIGNYVFSNEQISYEEILKFVGETGIGRAVVFYGNVNNINLINRITPNLENLSISVLDVVVTSSDNDTVHGYYRSMRTEGLLNEHQEKYGTGNSKLNEVNEPSENYNKPLRLPQTIARKTLDQMKADTRNKVSKAEMLDNAIDFIQNTNWYKILEDNQQARVNKTALKSLLENSIKDTNYLEDKVADYKQQIKDNKITARQVFDDIIAFLKTNQIKGKITPTEINRLIKSATQITLKKDTAKALDDFMNLYQIIKEKALLRVDNVAKEKAEVEYVVPIVESLVENGYDLEMVLNYFDTDSQKRMAEIQYHKEKSKQATEEERVNKTKEALEKQKQDLHNATHTSFREGLKKARLWYFNLVSDRSYVPANLMSKTGMQQTYYQFKNTKGYGHNAKEMYEKAHDKIWKGLTQDKIELLNDVVQMMRIITIDNNREQNGLSPVQHPNNLSKIDAQAWLDSKKTELGDKTFNDIQKRAKDYFKAYQEVLDLKLEHGFISQETYDALNGLDYQPRLFLHHAVNFDGDLSFEQKQQIITRSGLSKEQIKRLEDGSDNSLIGDAQWLLSNSISTLYQDIADNTLNKLFIAKEFPIAKEKYDTLLGKTESELTKEDKRFIGYFKELSDKVIPNEIMGFNADNNNPIYKNETPNHFVNKYYWADGVKHQFFMEENLAQQFEQAQEGFLKSNAKEIVGNVTGSRILKFFATGNNPLFIVVNTPRDFMWNILVSEHYSTFLPLAMAQMTYQLFPSTYDFKKTKLGRENTDMNLYFRNGGSMDYLHKTGQIAKKSFAYNWIKKPVTSIAGKNNQPIVEDKLRSNYLSKGTSTMNEWSEIAFRIATFRRSINASLKELGYNSDSEVTDLTDENGIVTETKQDRLNDIYRKATNDARSVLDFSQGGRLVKDLEEFLPYTNVAVQAARSYADAMKKRPLSTTLKTVQMAVGTTAGAITLAMYMLAGDDDEPEEEKGKTVEVKYVEFMQGISKDTRAKYYIIPTKQRDKDGNRIFYKIAKDQMLIPYMNLVETLIENRIRVRTGKYKEIGWDKIGKQLFSDVLDHNLSYRTLKDAPLFKAGTAWYAGYDLYRDKPLDKYAKTEALEGMNNENVEDFYKYFGRELGISPIRTKSAIESVITSPHSNPYLATGYEVMDYAFTDKSMESLGKGIQEMLFKGLKNRTTTKSTDWNRAENLLQETEDQQLNEMLKEEATRQLFKNKAEEVTKELFENKSEKEIEDIIQNKPEVVNDLVFPVINDLESQYKNDANYVSYVRSFRSVIKVAIVEQGTTGIMQKIKRENSPGARAVMINKSYGNVNSPENAEVKKLLIEKGVINQATLNYLDKK